MTNDNISQTAEPVTPNPVVKKRAVAKKTRSTKKTSAKKAVKKFSAKKKPSKTVKLVKTKLIRDSFAFPETEYASLVAVKKACLKAGIEIKKTELIRIGIALVSNLTTAKIKSAKAKLTPISAGRPKK